MGLRKILATTLGSLLLLILPLVGFCAETPSLGGPLLLQDEGMFFVNGKVVTSDYPAAPDTGKPVPGSVVKDQMYVHYRIPLNNKKTWPVVMVHGGGLTGMSYETTPDGREGWATYFVRNGYSVYVVDHPGRGRSGFDSTPINQGKVQANLALVPEIRRATKEWAWIEFRLGPTLGQTYPNQQFPVEALDSFGAQAVPYGEHTLVGGGLGTAPLALAALLDKVGPAIVIVHSQSGPYGDRLVGQRPNLVKAMINVEGNQFTIPTKQEIAAYNNVPTLEVFGDHIKGNTSSTGQSRYDGRKAVVEAINAAGGHAQIIQLPEVGLQGNSHMVMQDKNNLKVADYLQDWLNKNVK
jgi:pimeloyl-ACP methyl ester carboxylesterase